MKKTDSLSTGIDARLIKVLLHVNQQVGDDLSVATLSQIVCLSEFHFQRLFQSTFGLTIGRYVRQQRLKRAAFQLAYRQHKPIIDVAMENGFSTSENFSRAFKQVFAVNPRTYRNSPSQPSFTTGQDRLMQAITMKDVEILEFPETPVAVLLHKGLPSSLPRSIQRFIGWRKENDLPPQKSRTFNLVYDDPRETENPAFRFGLACAVPKQSYGLLPEMQYQTMPQGRCAKIRHIGPDHLMSPKIDYLYHHWLSSTDNTPRDFPLFFERVSFFPEVSELEMVTDIFLPIE